MKPVWTPSEAPISRSIDLVSTIELLVPVDAVAYTLTIPMLLPEESISASIRVKTLPTSLEFTLVRCCTADDKLQAVQVKFDSLIAFPSSNLKKMKLSIGQ